MDNDNLLPQAQPSNPPVVDAAQAHAQPSASVAPAQVQSDPKLLQDDAVEQIEAAIAQTTTNPAERALQVHAIKATYLKARYNVEVKGSAQ